VNGIVAFLRGNEIGIKDSEECFHEVGIRLSR
jgi:hypothetical protein